MYNRFFKLRTQQLLPQVLEILTGNNLAISLAEGHVTALKHLEH